MLSEPKTNWSNQPIIATGSKKQGNQLHSKQELFI